MWDDFRLSLESLRSQDRLRQLRVRRPDGMYLIEEDGRRLVNFGSNDYLGLASSLPQPSDQAGLQVVDGQTVDPGIESGLGGATASGLVCGWTSRHQMLADQLCEFEQAESAIVFPSGFAACSGSVATLARAGDLILSDALNHASLIDGCRLSRADRVVYPHRDVGEVRRLLEQNRRRYDRVWIVTDAVFSMDGHVAPLPDLCDLADEFSADMIVDEAHATGILGQHATGACEALNVKERVAVRIGTLSKALGGQGGFVVGPRPLMDYLINRCRPLIYSTALSLPAVESALVALNLGEALLRRRDRVVELSRRLRMALEIAADPIESMVPIVPLPLGADEKAVWASEQLRRLGLFVPAIRPPTVAEGCARLRISLSSAHDEQMFELLLEGLGSL